MSRLQAMSNPAMSAELQKSFGSISPIGRLMKIPLTEIIPWDDNPFGAQSEEEFDELVESIRMNGLHEPIIVRMLLNPPRYQILSGHNRYRAHEVLKKDTIDCRVFDNMTDDDAVIKVTETNLVRRKKLRYSDMARAYKLLLDTMRKQGKRSDLSPDGIESNSIDNSEEARSRNIVAHRVGVSGRTIGRYLRLNNLVDDILQRLDDEELSFSAGVALSYLTEPNQIHIASLLRLRPELSITMSTAEKLKHLSQERSSGLTEGEINEILFGHVNLVNIEATISPQISITSRTDDSILPNESAPLKAKRSKSLTYLDFLKELRTLKKITPNEQKQIEVAVAEAVLTAENEAIRDYLRSVGKLDEDIEEYLTLRESI